MLFLWQLYTPNEMSMNFILKMHTLNVEEIYLQNEQQWPIHEDAQCVSTHLGVTTHRQGFYLA